MIINSSVQDAESKSYVDLPRAEQNQLWQIFSDLLEYIISIAGRALGFIKTNASKLFELSCKLVGIAVTGINLTVAKIQQLTAYISQINLSVINLAPQTTIHHHHMHHYHVYPHDAAQGERYGQPLGVAY